MISIFVIRKQRKIMKPQDILILLKLIVIGQRDWIYEELASELFMSKSEIHAGNYTARGHNLNF